MGVRGLSTFVDSNPDLLTQHRLHDCKVIIDGNNLMYFLFHHYKVCHVFGGDMDRYARKCKRFFNTFKACHITPYVVFDGGYDPDDRKLSTIMARMVDRRRTANLICKTGRGTILPILAYETFRQVLEDFDVPHAACLFEADREIAVLAKRWQCPVMSNDSDFFVYNLPAGFVPFDYVNMTLCVYDTKTNKESVQEIGEKVTSSQYVYIPVKLYLCERFFKHYRQNIQPWCLPLLATMNGNDYVDAKLLCNFYATIRVPKCSNRKFLVPKHNTKLIALLHWLDCVEDARLAIGEVCDKFSTESREKMQAILSQSINDYYNIDHFIGINLESFFDKMKTSTDSGFEYENCGKHQDYDGNELPDWFVEGLHRCAIAAPLQNAAVLHRMLFQCQVEIIQEPSTYKCSRKIREVIYGILIQKNFIDEESRCTCVVEYDRVIKDTKKIFVHPQHSVDGFTQLPRLSELEDMSDQDKRKLILSTLGMKVDKVIEETGTDGSSLILCGVIGYWIKNAKPKVTVHHLTSLLVCVVLLHVRTLRWMDQKLILGGHTPVSTHLYSELVSAYKSSTDKQITKFVKHMDKYLKRPDHSGKHPCDNKVVHGFSQLQTCLWDTIHMNQLLNCPAVPISPSVVFNGTFVYNLCRDLENRSQPDMFVSEFLTRDSPLHKSFVSLKAQVMNIVKEEDFEPMKNVASSKSKARRARSSRETVREADTATARQVGSRQKQRKVDKMEVNCRVQNKFSMLGLDDDDDENDDKEDDDKDDKDDE